MHFNIPTLSVSTCSQPNFTQLFDFQSSERDVEVSEHVKRFGERVAGSPQAASGEITYTNNLKSSYMCHPQHSASIYFPLPDSFCCQSEANNTAMLGKLMSIASE